MRWRGLPLQLFVFTVLPLTVLLLVIAFGSLFLHQRAMRRLVGERDERATRAAASAITEQLNHRSAAMRSLALRASDTQDGEHVLADVVFLLPDFSGGIALFDADGRLQATSNATPTWELTAAPDLITAIPPETVQFSSPFTDPLTGEEMILTIARAPDGMTAVGAFYPAVLAQKALKDIFAAGDQAAAFLTDGNGRLLFQLGDVHEMGANLSGYQGITEALRGKNGTTYSVEDGEEYVIAFSTIPPLNWALVLKEPWRAVTDPLLRATELAPLVLAPVLIIALIGLGFGIRQIVAPLQSLEKKATALAWGDFEAIEKPVGGINEIQRLQTELIHMAHKVKLAQQSLRSYLGAVTTGQEEERRRLARDLHDDTIQSLIALNQRLQLAQLTVSDEQSGTQLTEMQQMTEQTIADLRRLTRDLRPIYLEDLGLVTALNMLARDASQTLQIPVDFQVTGTEKRLSAEVELALYRMAQEGLSNVARHAQANCAQLHLAFADESITLTIQDDGRGFTIPESPAEMTNNGHYGLLGIQERAELIGARLTILSAPGKGTNLTIVLPIAVNENNLL
ncbi:MAG TPA: HAMP domain-containing protein [Anaerolineae bacterium]|nr:HAMP domain-containing protein [Anaerolineae bacterium]